MNKTKIESLKEMRNACAACFRVIARHGLGEELEIELTISYVEKGFGVRFQKLIDELDGKEYREIPK